ncbi:hypothetical protein SUDANB121_01316 [Nocardiopsis dassonvillei]|uniref:hypothetical protein n=1 Tax=Nocardiopsis dassonvillei TaxID=2014 RepID=UPI003F542F2B
MDGSTGGDALWSHIERFGTGRVARVVVAHRTPEVPDAPDRPRGSYGYIEENADTYFRDGTPGTGRGAPLRRGGTSAVRLLRVVRGTDPAPREQEREPLNDRAGRDRRVAIAGADVPALFVAGERSAVRPAEHAAASAAPNPRASAAVVRWAGHAVDTEGFRAFDRGPVECLRRGAATARRPRKAGRRGSAGGAIV